MNENSRPAPGEGLDIASEMRIAKEAGKSYWEITRELVKLGRGLNKLTREEYFLFQLWKHSPQEQSEFLGKAAWPNVYKAVADFDYNILMHDKLLCYGLLEKFGFPIPRTRALLDPIRAFDTKVCRSKEDLKSFLNEASLPLIAKPVTGMYSTGIHLIRKFEGEHFVSQEGEVPLATICDSKAPYMFQDVLCPHKDLQTISSSIGSLRLIVLLDQEPELLYAIWKIPTGQNIADNFWRGNLLGTVKDGKVVRVIDHDRNEITAHPDNGAPLMIELPDYQDAVDLAFRCAPYFSATRLQAYDIALTDEGPTIVEVNVGGDFDLPQLAAQRGFLSGRIKEFLDSRQPQK